MSFGFQSSVLVNKARKINAVRKIPHSVLFHIGQALIKAIYILFAQKYIKYPQIMPNMSILERIKKIPVEVKYTLILFVFTRIALTLVGFISRGLNNKKVLSLDMWSQWDSGWYLNIIKDWYPTVTNFDPGAQTNYGFFPLYSMVSKIFGLILYDNYLLAGIIISNICLIISCILLYKIVTADSDQATGIRSIKYLFLFPTAFILSGMLTESLTLMLMLICFYYAKKEKWLFVGISGFLLALTRSIGVLVVFPIAWEYLKSKKFSLRKIKLDSLYLLLFPAGILAFFTRLYFATGDFLAYTHVKQKAWSLIPTDPFVLLYKGIISHDTTTTFNTLFMTCAILVLLVFYKKIDFSYWILGMIMTIFPTAHVWSITGLARYTVIVFPLFIIFAKITENKYVDECLSAFLALLQGCLMVFWCVGWFFII
jgi:hypothetical protein